MKKTRTSRNRQISKKKILIKTKEMVIISRHRAKMLRSLKIRNSNSRHTS